MSTIYLAFHDAGVEGQFMNYSELYFTFAISYHGACLMVSSYFLNSTNKIGRNRERKQLKYCFSKLSGEGRR